jgi:hypothetical protein
MHFCYNKHVYEAVMLMPLAASHSLWGSRRGHQPLMLLLVAVLGQQNLAVHTVIAMKIDQSEAS